MLISEEILSSLLKPKQNFLCRFHSVISQNNLVIKYLGLSFVNNDKKDLELAIFLFRKLLPKGRKIILDFLINNEFKEHELISLDTLYYLYEWDDPNAFILLNRYEYKLTKTEYRFFRIIENCSVYNIDLAISIYQKDLISRIDSLKNTEQGLILIFYIRIENYLKSSLK